MLKLFELDVEFNVGPYLTAWPVLQGHGEMANAETREGSTTAEI